MNALMGRWPEVLKPIPGGTGSSYRSRPVFCQFNPRPTSTSCPCNQQDLWAIFTPELQGQSPLWVPGPKSYPVPGLPWAFLHGPLFWHPCFLHTGNSHGYSWREGPPIVPRRPAEVQLLAPGHSRAVLCSPLGRHPAPSLAPQFCMQWEEFRVWSKTYQNSGPRYVGLLPLIVMNENNNRWQVLEGHTLT